MIMHVMLLGGYVRVECRVYRVQGKPIINYFVPVHHPVDGSKKGDVWQFVDFETAKDMAERTGY